MKKKFIFAIISTFLVLSLFAFGCSKDSGALDETLSTAASEDALKVTEDSRQDKTEAITQNLTTSSVQEDFVLTESTDGETLQSEASEGESVKEPFSKAEDDTYPVEVEIDFSEFE